MELMTDQQRRERNLEEIKSLQKNQEQLLSTVSELRSKALRTFKGIEAMVWLTFAIGVMLIVISLGYYILERQTIETLGFSAIGLADFATIFFYKPMDRIQSADANYSQQEMILNTWATATQLELIAMNVNEPDTVQRAAKNIENRTLQALREINSFVEPEEITGKKK